MKNEFKENEPSEVYFSKKEYLSRSGILHVLKSPAHYLAYSEGLLKEEVSDAMKFGQVAHAMLLEPQEFRSRLSIMPDFGDLRSSKNREAKSAWLADQRPEAMIVTPEEAEQLTGIANSILSHSVAASIFKDGKSEVSGYYTDPETGLDCRIRIDFLNNKIPAIVDLKTARDASKKRFINAIYNDKYHLQLAMYAEGYKQIVGELPKMCVFVVVEKTPPYAVAVYVADDAMLEVGMRLYRKGLDLIKKCKATNYWPGYQTEAEMISLPHYALNEEEL